MKKIGFIIPNYPGEKRVCILPSDVHKIDREIWIETGFGKTLEIKDEDYINAGAKIQSRQEIFRHCDNIVSLKLIQPSDYKYLRAETNIIGWTHPLGSGKQFRYTQAIPKKIAIFDLDGKNPTLYLGNESKKIEEIKENFLFENSYLAGSASVLHALLSFGKLPEHDEKIAVLSSGNVSQGAFNTLSSLGLKPRIYYRSTMNEFRKELEHFDYIINGIETDSGYILDKNDLKKIKEGALIIDAAADAGNTIYGTEFTNFLEPIRKMNHFFYYCINNSPSIFYKNISAKLSETLTDNIYNLDFDYLKKRMSESNE